MAPALPDPPLSSDGVISLRGLADGTRASFAVVDARDGRMLGAGGLMAMPVAEPLLQREETAPCVDDRFVARTRGG